MIILREYQRECIDIIKNKHADGKHRLLVSLPTASGKTVIFAYLIQETRYRTLVLAHTYELQDQAKNKINMFCPEINVGLVNSDYKQFDSQVVVCSIQSATLPNNLAQLLRQNFDLIVYDETHRACADGARKVLDTLGFGKGTQKLLVGFTATAFRSDGKGLLEVFDEVVYERNTKEMIDEGFLCPPIGFKIATNVDLSKVKTENGDFKTASLAQVMDTPVMNEIIVNAYIENAYGKKTIMFSVSVQHAKNVSQVFQDHGITSKVIYGDMPKKERIAILDEYESGLIKVLCNCAVLTEGFDSPSTECIIVGRPTKSKGLYTQMVGRGLRRHPNKKSCIVLDFDDNNHSICNTAMLLMDDANQPEKNNNHEKYNVEIPASIPAKLNPNLKAILLEYDPLSQDFNWKKEDRTYSMKAQNGVLKVTPSINDTYIVTFEESSEYRVIAHNLSFEYAFATADEFAKKNRHLFVLSDKAALWRNDPISDGQKKLFKRYRFTAGINKLTKGQAAILIDNGALHRVSNN